MLMNSRYNPLRPIAKNFFHCLFQIELLLTESFTIMYILAPLIISYDNSFYRIVESIFICSYQIQLLKTIFNSSSEKPLKNSAN